MCNFSKCAFKVKRCVSIKGFQPLHGTMSAELKPTHSIFADRTEHNDAQDHPQSPALECFFLPTGQSYLRSLVLPRQLF